MTLTDGRLDWAQDVASALGSLPEPEARLPHWAYADRLDQDRIAETVATVATGLRRLAHPSNRA